MISAINKQGEEWHREIDNVIRKMLSNIENTVSKKLVVLKEQEVEINHSLSEITLNINELKKLLESNDSKLLYKYKFRNAEFRRLPPKLVISLPNFYPPRIDTYKLFQQFSSLQAFPITTEERLYPIISTEIDISHYGKQKDEEEWLDENCKTPCKNEEEWFDENGKTKSKKEDQWFDGKYYTDKIYGDKS